MRFQVVVWFTFLLACFFEPLPVQDSPKAGSRHFSDVVVRDFSLFSGKSEAIYWDNSFFSENDAFIIARGALKKEIDSNSLIFVLTSVLSRDPSISSAAREHLYELFSKEGYSQYFPSQISRISAREVRRGSSGDVRFLPNPARREIHQALFLMWGVAVGRLIQRDLIFLNEQDLAATLTSRIPKSPSIERVDESEIKSDDWGWLDSIHGKTLVFLETKKMTEKFGAFLKGDASGRVRSWKELTFADWGDSERAFSNSRSGTPSTTNQKGWKQADYCFVRILEQILRLNLKSGAKVDKDLLFFLNDFILGRNPHAKRRAFGILRLALSGDKDLKESDVDAFEVRLSSFTETGDPTVFDFLRAYSENLSKIANLQ